MHRVESLEKHGFPLPTERTNLVPKAIKQQRTVDRPRIVHQRLRGRMGVANRPARTPAVSLRSLVTDGVQLGAEPRDFGFRCLARPNLRGGQRFRLFARFLR